MAVLLLFDVFERDRWSQGLTDAGKIPGRRATKPWFCRPWWSVSSTLKAANLRRRPFSPGHDSFSLFSGGAQTTVGSMASSLVFLRLVPQGLLCNFHFFGVLAAFVPRQVYFRLFLISVYKHGYRAWIFWAGPTRLNRAGPGRRPVVGRAFCVCRHVGQPEHGNKSPAAPGTALARWPEHG